MLPSLNYFNLSYCGLDTRHLEYLLTQTGTSNLEYLVLQGNKIHLLPNKKELSCPLKFLDLRENPICRIKWNIVYRKIVILVWKKLNYLKFDRDLDPTHHVLAPTDA